MESIRTNSIVSVMAVKNTQTRQETQTVQTIQRGQIWYADLGEQKGSIQKGKKPVVIISNWKCNLHSPVVMIAPITRKVHNKALLPTHVELGYNDSVREESIVLIEQCRQINKEDLLFLIGNVSQEKIGLINKAYAIEGEIFDIIDINGFIELNEKINDLLDYLDDEGDDEERDIEAYNECSMLMTELKRKCYMSGIDFENKFYRMIRKFRNLSNKEGVRSVI